MRQVILNPRSVGAKKHKEGTSWIESVSFCSLMELFTSRRCNSLMRAGTIASPQTMLKWNRANSVLKYKVSSLLLYVTAFYFLLLTWHLKLCPLSSVGFFFGGEEGVGIVKVAGDVNLCSAWSFLKLWFLFYYIQLKAVLIKVTNPWFFFYHYIGQLIPSPKLANRQPQWLAQ